MKKIKKIIEEAFRQSWNNKNSYLFLSVTIVLTFSVIGFYIIYLDSKIYNNYKYAMLESPNMSFVEYDDTNQSRIDLLKKKLDTLDNTHYYSTGEITGIDIFDTYSDEVKFTLVLKVVPNNVWAYYWGTGYRLELVDGSKKFSLKDDEVIINEKFFEFLYKTHGNKESEMSITVPGIKKLKVADVCKDFGDDKYVNEEGITHYFFYGFVTHNCVKDYDIDNKKLVIYSADSKKIEEYSKDLGLVVYSSYNDKVNMNKDIISSIEQKKSNTNCNYDDSGD